MAEMYDLIVVGAGPAGLMASKVAAFRKIMQFAKSLFLVFNKKPRGNTTYILTYIAN